MPTRRFVTIGPALVVLTVAAIAVFAAPSAVRHVRLSRTRATVALAQQRLDTDNTLAKLSEAVADLSDAVGPSVVHIEAAIGNDPFSEGAGWIYDDKGDIVTNAHVVRDANSLTVQFADGRAMAGRFVGADAATDIAVIRVDPDPAIIPARRAAADSLRRGERVFAFGSPFGFKFSMTEGIVSGLGRAAEGPTGRTGYSNFIQTDAAANPGNSGGPLVDVSGRVVGMITAIVTANNIRANPNPRMYRDDVQGQSAGVGFAIPIETIDAVVSQIVAKGVVLRGYVGVGLLDRDELLQAARSGEMDRLIARDAEFGAAVNGADPEKLSGVLVTMVQGGQAGQRAGLKPGDVITHLDGLRVHASAVLRSRISTHKAGDTVTLSLLREGKQVEARVTLGAAAVNEAGVLEPIDVKPIEKNQL